MTQYVQTALTDDPVLSRLGRACQAIRRNVHSVSRTRNVFSISNCSNKYWAKHSKPVWEQISLPLSWVLLQALGAILVIYHAEMYFSSWPPNQLDKCRQDVEALKFWSQNLLPKYRNKFSPRPNRDLCLYLIRISTVVTGFIRLVVK